jgi:acyl-coenzyme A thioesterase PaaI-like protein
MRVRIPPPVPNPYGDSVDLQSLQLRYAPEGRCFGCGPKNPDGLRIRSYEAGDGTVVATWQPRPEHEAFDGFVNGGILGTLIDCHSNWTAIVALIAKTSATEAPSTVTSEYSVRFERPTPSDQPLRLIGRAVDVRDDRVTVETTVEVDGATTAKGRATFVAVRPGHPAYGRW